MTGGCFPFSTITEITIGQAKPIIAPKYILYPKITEKEQIESEKKCTEYNTEKKPTYNNAYNSLRQNFFTENFYL